MLSTDFIKGMPLAFTQSLHFFWMFFQQIVPPVLLSFSDQDSRVRYYACEALYNIGKVKCGSVPLYCGFICLVVLLLFMCTVAGSNHSKMSCRL